MHQDTVSVAAVYWYVKSKHYTRNSSFLKTAILGTLNLQGAAQQSSPSPQGQLFDPHTRSRKIYHFLHLLQELQHHVWHWGKKLLKTSSAIHVTITVALSLRTLAERLTAGVSPETRDCDQSKIFTTDILQYFSLETTWEHEDNTFTLRYPVDIFCRLIFIIGKTGEPHMTLLFLLHKHYRVAGAVLSKLVDAGSCTGYTAFLNCWRKSAWCPRALRGESPL